ncbi:sulfatase-like hydrolase/transferase [Runella aurantiaca]|uniref:Uncharacterized protein n=1 Tax=Runella aurantiaca TaxID=2282308 RepID=A0A369IGU9_9BACT|nr:sulfatase-like hydrolase/transferase [Runella aurantiaca]RDB07425.1 hypothetical protein DVG78_05340 [Runella aurantiaca]
MGSPLTEETMADVLERSGYQSMLVGKWHLRASLKVCVFMTSNVGVY